MNSLMHYRLHHCNPRRAVARRSFGLRTGVRFTMTCNIIFWCIAIVSSILPSPTTTQNMEEAKVLHSPQSVNISINNEAEFNCTTNSENIVWTVNGTEINSGQSQLQIAQGIYLSTLKLTALSSLSVTCTSVKLNPPSSSESEQALLLVQGLLESVNNLSVILINSTTVLISWSPPFTLEGVPILGYNITITSTTSGENETVSVEGDTTMLYYSISKIASFNLTVVPINEVGTGDKSSISYDTRTSSSDSQVVFSSVSTLASGTPGTPISLSSAAVNNLPAATTSTTTSKTAVPSVMVASVYARETRTNIVMPSKFPNNLPVEAIVGGTVVPAVFLIGMLMLIILFACIFCCGHRVSKTLDKKSWATPLRRLTKSKIPAYQDDIPSQPDVINIQSTLNLSADETADTPADPPADTPADTPAVPLTVPPADPPADTPADTPAVPLTVPPADPLTDPPVVPLTDPPAEFTVDHSEIWYFRELKREEAESKCSNAGDYLVRYNLQHYKYTLTVKPKLGLHLHILIQETGDAANPRYSFGEKEFSSICCMLDEYAEKQITVTVQNSEAFLINFITNNRWSIRQDEYELTGAKIGQGAFGEVLEAHLIKNNRKVAVKTCNSTHTNAEKRNFLHEADILSRYHNTYIVELIGVVANQNPLCIVMEHVGWTFRFFLEKKGPECTKTKLTQMCTQVCNGMDYLERNNGIHCSLSARNCLVTERNNIVKISNFGTSAHGKMNLGFLEAKLRVRPPPIKWTAPEALEFSKYSIASDVWSFGVLLWETFSFGKEPYPDLTDHEAKYKVIHEGNTLPFPEGCPESVFTVMTRCLKRNENERPRFSELLSELIMIGTETA